MGHLGWAAVEKLQSAVVETQWEEQNSVALSGGREWTFAASELCAWETCNLMVKVEEAGEGCESLARSS